MGIPRWPQRRLKALNESLFKLRIVKQTPEIEEKIARVQAEIDEICSSPHRRKHSTKRTKVQDTEMVSCAVAEEELCVKKEREQPDPVEHIRTPYLKLDLHAVLQLLNQQHGQTLRTTECTRIFQYY
jgi:hypothetical protein